MFLSSNTPYCQKFKAECLDFNEKTEDSLDRTSVPHRDAQDFVCHGCYMGKGEWVGGWGVSPTLSESQAADKCKQPWRILVWWQNTTSSYLTKLWSKRFYTHYSLYFYLTCYILFLLCDPSCRWLIKIKGFNPLAGCILMRTSPLLAPVHLPWQHHW